MNIEDLSFHDAIIISVAENTVDQSFEFLLSFPTNWDDNVFEPKILRFTDVTFYSVDEIPFNGQPAIVNIESCGAVTKPLNAGLNPFLFTRQKIKILTNAGDRFIEYADCFLLDASK
ncbi:hypothetical protein [Spirosoma rhododendri]|uniref:Immunity protein 50 n=1 Tax=Spirosoma rhododendri TaxID=2728024 RepID=A0A7L5DRQ7_9BACT|nr:hypothetical protein [Spirosoma rhododendri]QJD80292.1 hypothetical protein HH216_19090 [Spirosoma rhododendri]